MSSRRRLYLNLGQGIVKLFRTTAHWLSDFTGKWSLYEKPYLDQDYRAMQLKFPTPTWDPPGGGGGDPDPRTPWPEEPGIRTFVWDPGICTVGVIRGECGEIFTLEASIGLSSPWELFGIDWSAHVVDGNAGKITDVTKGIISWAVNIKGIVADDFTGSLVVCVKAVNIGRLRNTLVVEGASQLTYEAALLLPPLEETYYSGNTYPCGCTEIPITCDECIDDSGMAWDDELSAETIARNNSVLVAITDSLGTGGPYEWSVAGTGYTLNNPTTTGLTNMLNADGTACGTATITVTGCDGNVVTGYVKSTTGIWVEISNCSAAGCGGGACNLTEIIGRFRIYNVRCGRGPDPPCSCQLPTCEGKTYCKQELIEEWQCE